MASITIRNLDDGVKKRLRLRAAENGRSMEEEARDILGKELDTRPRQKRETGLDLWNDIRRRVEPLGGVELKIPRRGPMRKIPDFK
jgi:antitoxin FitA